MFSNKYFKYTGDWALGELHGHGVLCLGDGSSYEGEFEKGEITGKGLRRWADGSTYSGNFFRGELHGEGMFRSEKSFTLIICLNQGSTLPRGVKNMKDNTCLISDMVPASSCVPMATNMKASLNVIDFAAMGH